MDKAKPKRRWLQFSLPTLLVAVTVFAIPLNWLAFEALTVGERRQTRQILTEGGGMVQIGFPEHLHWFPSGISPEQAAEESAFRAGWGVSVIRGWMGDEAVGYIELPWTYRDADKARIETIFPEAKVDLFDPTRH